LPKSPAKALYFSTNSCNDIIGARRGSAAMGDS
jgi:hypothetical protein